jgi:hypothetical protein
MLHELPCILHSHTDPSLLRPDRRAEAKQAAIEAQKEAMAAASQDAVPPKKRKREREESVATGDGESVRPSGNRKKNRGGDDD